MEIRQLKTFLSVFEKQSFTRAAEQLNMAQSSVSAQIRALEDDLAVKLFDRIGRQVVHTQAGQRLSEYARRIVGMSEEIRSEVGGAGATAGRLTIRLPETLATVYMPDVITAFHREYPDVRLEFIHCSDLRLSRELNSGRIDLAFLMTDDMHIRDVNIELIRMEPLVFALSPVHPLAQAGLRDLPDVAAQTLFHPRTD